MNILALKHFAFDDIHALSMWSNRHGHVLNVHDPSLGLRMEWLNSIDLLIILGGPMSVYQESLYPWLAEEKRFVEQAILRGKKVLGICLGAQMLAELLGGRVYRHTCKEIGWHRILRTGEEHPWFKEIPANFHSFQWHGDTFDLPQGARRLAWSDGCANQAFAYDARIVGLQFHLETTPACIEEMLAQWAGELGAGPYIQTADEIRRGMGRSSESFRLLHSIMEQTL
ncbi:type 1 glutamine amidotransferase [Paenibacillus oenotherae]|uniref:Type 1 glutamine amidotransferase n=1 Tax=Paenibacillus oenotherae TaxID=1435645 RepID=A0ABS7DD77_9BACL|nr:type 1 glutamine amidotransferase [Paenibacillus oenotherae]MBW7477113.1 type 1 glutamine amidotransferase [Paenibacillus oenotherae]